MKPLYRTFPRLDLNDHPIAKMSQTELEFYWELLEFTDLLLRRMGVRSGRESFKRFKGKLRGMCSRAHDSMIVPSPAIEYYQGETVDWISINMALISDFLRGAKALHFLKHSNYCPVSSFTGCDILLNDPRMPKSAAESPEHLFYRMLVGSLSLSADGVYSWS
ncbi:hypothetical protein SeMB42_g06833 [Synchytrium endobioticum]|uniref:Uncharacterized protein n=1 Tax=Synchytrium endobioticum TaxID=286115 RepID=A0A507CJ98_9FUNG|nr:hypothetical protein SeMB42_g06833 [Synchytrium endobioticum]